MLTSSQRQNSYKRVKVESVGIGCYAITQAGGVLGASVVAKPFLPPTPTSSNRGFLNYSFQ